MMQRTGSALKGDRAWLQRSLHREELVAYLLAVQVLYYIVGQSNLLELAEGVALHSKRTCERLASERRACLCLLPPLNRHVSAHAVTSHKARWMPEAYEKRWASIVCSAAQDGTQELHLGVAGVLVHDQIERLQASERQQQLLHLRMASPRMRFPQPQAQIDDQSVPDRPWASQALEMVRSDGITLGGRS